MAYLLALTETFTANVEVLTPSETGGHDRTKFKGIFKRPSTADLEGIAQMEDADLMAKFFTGFSDLPKEGGGVVESTPEHIEALLAIPEALYGLSKAFLDAVLKGRQKN